MSRMMDIERKARTEYRKAGRPRPVLQHDGSFRARGAALLLQRILLPDERIVFADHGILPTSVEGEAERILAVFLEHKPSPQAVRLFTTITDAEYAFLLNEPVPELHPFLRRMQEWYPDTAQSTAATARYFAGKRKGTHIKQETKKA